jgi:2-phospho-L-lactate guanylyltransferase
MENHAGHTPTLAAVPASGNPTAVLIPVKAFGDAKARLADALDPAERAALARSMATTVVRAAAPLDVWVVCDDDAVAVWATDLGTNVLWKPGRGLNGAVNEGVADLADREIDRVIVAHADLPHAENLEWLLVDAGVTLVPDRHEDGTNVAVIPTHCGFVFSYGPDSFHRHIAEAERLGLETHIVRDERLGWDVDRPDDLATPSWIVRR